MRVLYHQATGVFEGNKMPLTDFFEKTFTDNSRPFLILIGYP